MPGSIAQLVDVSIGGHDQAIMLRGASAKAPVLLFLEGGPGGTGIGRMRNSGTDLEQKFMVATWDQRGTGKSYRGPGTVRDLDGGPDGQGHPRGR